MSLADFNWLSDQLWEELQQDLLGRGEPLTVEAQVAAGLYCLGHGASHITIGGGFIDLLVVVQAGLTAAAHGLCGRGQQGIRKMPVRR